MKCPVCESPVTPDTIRCDCGFYLDLAVDPLNSPVEKNSSAPSRKKRSAGPSALLEGLIWALGGILLFATFILMEGISTPLRDKLLTASFLSAVYGFYLLSIGHGRIQIPGTSDRRATDIGTPDK